MRFIGATFFDDFLDNDSFLFLLALDDTAASEASNCAEDAQNDSADNETLDEFIVCVLSHSVHHAANTHIAVSITITTVTSPADDGCPLDARSK